MATPRVVPAFDEIEDGETGLHLRPEAMPVQELALERCEEAFTERVVVGIPDAAHRRPDPGLGTALAEGDRRVLRRFKGSSQRWRVQHIVVDRRELRLEFSS